MREFEIYRRVLPSVGPIILRNVFILVNIVITAVVVLLFIFGNTQAAFFIGIVFFINTLVVVVQDIRARIILERLQMLTALRVTRINDDKTFSFILADEVQKGDKLKLKLGDQVPCEGIIISSDNMEISEALITGESDTFGKVEGEKIIAGAVVTSGNGIMEAEGIFRESRLFAISKDIKKYAANPSSIQQAIDLVIKYSGYCLVAALLFVVLRGVVLGVPKTQIVMNAGALASTLVPQGLVVAITLLFAIGAMAYSKRDVLFQEINATEKLGRIKNLCIDKTGTLTDNILVVEKIHVGKNFTEEKSLSFIHDCIIETKDSSQTVLAITKYIDEQGQKDFENIEIGAVLPFSSWRRYSGIEIKENNNFRTIFMGAADIFLSGVLSEEEKKWLVEITEENSKKGRRVLCIGIANGKDLLKDPSSASFEMLAVFVFHNTLRKGIKDAIKFFQDRDINIRVISGDNAHTVQAVASDVGIKNTINVITGEQMKDWSEKDFDTLAHEYSIFAQVLPEHKVKLVEAFKKDGFTAMVGDGVNDALAIKKADLGIAMFDGAPVARQLSDVILMTNSFSDLPGAIKLADSFIRSIEINSGIYINQSIVGFIFFVVISIFGYAFPLTPLNITFMNYFTVGIPTMLTTYWALLPSSKISPTDKRPFLKRVMPLVFYGGIVEAIGVILVFFFSPSSLKTVSSNIFVLFSLILFGYLFLLLAAKVYFGTLSKKEKLQLFYLGIFEVVLLFILLQIPAVVHFFGIIFP